MLLLFLRAGTCLTCIAPFITAADDIINRIQSTLVISNSKGLSEILRDIRTSTYQICRNEEKIKQTSTFNKCICNLTPEVRYILKILWKRGAIAPSFPQYFVNLLLDFHV